MKAEMTVEVNGTTVSDLPAIDLGSVSVLITPDIDENYWLTRVVLHKDQAVQTFPKFGVIGCGFAIEDDWNTNLPLACPASKIVRHTRK